VVRVGLRQGRSLGHRLVYLVYLEVIRQRRVAGEKGWRIWIWVGSGLQRYMVDRIGDIRGMGLGMDHRISS